MATAAAQAVSPTFGRSELERQIDLALPATLGMDVADSRELITALADRAISSGALVPVTGEQTTASVPAELRTADGRSVYETPYGQRWSTREHWVAEVALTRAAVERGGRSVDAGDVDRWMKTSVAGGELSEDQAAAVRGLLTSGARLSVLVGPAGTGKSFTMGAAASAWSEMTGGRVIGLATSQIATEVLAEMGDDGVPALNVSRWLAAQTAAEDGSTDPAVRQWVLTPDDVIVVDESSMVDTPALTRIWEHVHAAGARMVLTGDPRQLGAVGAGGVMEMLADGRAETHTLAEVRRFDQPWEARASLRLREGDTKVLTEYDRRGRVLDAGTAATAVHSAARAYLGDTLAGHTALVIAATNAEAAEVSAIVRAELVRLGRVEEGGALLGRDGNVAGVGDVVQARRNDWAVGVINRRAYTVAELREDGSMRLEARDGSGSRTVPAGYVARDLSLGYCSTAHSAQGLTVDRSHAIVTSQMSRASMYVALSRGQDANTAHVVTRSEVDDAPTGETHDREPRAATAVLADVLEADTTDQRAALVQRVEDARAARSMYTVHALREDAVRLACRARTDVWLDRLAADGVITADERAAFASDAGSRQLASQLRAVELAGHDPEAAMRAALEGRTLDGARSVAQVTQSRITAAHVERGLAPRGLDISSPHLAEISDEYRDYLEELADVALERRHELAAEMANDPPAWALEALGPVPDDLIGRAEWEDRAGRVAAYRELDKTDDDAVIGASPGLSTPEKRVEWYRAWDALGRPDAATEGTELSEGALRVRIEAWQREQAWQPRHVDDELRATALHVQRHMQDAAILRARADVADDPAEVERLNTEATGKETLAVLLAETEEKLSEAAAMRAEWVVETAQTRLAAEQATKALADRGVAVGAEPDRVTAAEWLAAHRAEQAVEDEHRVATDDVDLVDEIEARHADERTVSNDVNADIAAQITDDQATQAGNNVPSSDAATESSDSLESGGSREQDANWHLAEVDQLDPPAMPAGVPVRAEVEATTLTAELAADEMADRRSAEQSHELYADDEQATREQAWREQDAAEQAREDDLAMDY